jgi:excisionase family DNA binding protein
MAHHPSFRFVRRLAELECRPIQRSLAYQQRSSSLNTPRNTSNKVFCVSTSEAATLAPAVRFEPLINPVEAAKLLGIHAKTLIKLARASLIPAIRIGKHWRFRASWLNAYIAKQLQSSGQPA